VILFVVYYAAAPFLLAALAYIAEKATQEDEDLAWVEREIERAENGGSPYETDDMREQRRLHLQRLYRVRDRIEGKP
jgi:hypothetical protein